ncbi:Uncharacterised protein [Mycobacterium tuberculosis]|nr:Uncharacterised protein [Mycobacterium tuberculosis]
MFPSPLGVLGLTTSDSISPGGQQISHVSVPSRGFGSDDTWGEGMAMMVDEVSVPSRGFGSDDRLKLKPEMTTHLCFRPLSGFWV